MTAMNTSAGGSVLEESESHPINDTYLKTKTCKKEMEEGILYSLNNSQISNVFSYALSFASETDQESIKIVNPELSNLNFEANLPFLQILDSPDISD